MPFSESEGGGGDGEGDRSRGGERGDFLDDESLLLGSLSNFLCLLLLLLLDFRSLLPLLFLPEEVAEAAAGDFDLRASSIGGVESLDGLTSEAGRMGELEPLKSPRMVGGGGGVSPFSLDFGEDLVLDG